MQKPRYFLGILFFLLPSILLAQYPLRDALNLEKRQARLRAFAEEVHLRDSLNLQEALRLAAEKGWPVYEETPDGQVIALQGVDEVGLPIYYITENVGAAITIATNHLWPGGRSGLNLSGSSPAMSGRLGIWDSGRVRETHQEFVGRVDQVDRATSISSHATAVAGTMAASGINTDARGMAYGLDLLLAWDWSNDIAEMAAAGDKLLVSNHSYGAIAGWRRNTNRAGTASDPQWEWWGDPSVSTYEDYRLGYYNTKARDWDKISYEAPYYLIVKSAGNKRNDNGPSVGQPYWTRTAAGGWELVSARQAGAVSSNDGYNILPMYANAKNILLVGAVNEIPGGYTEPEDVVMSSFSSWGPTDDGRIKPDVVTKGVSLFTVGSTNNTHYRSTSGTSLASPNAAGSLLLIQELYRQLTDTVMLSSTLRGLAIHTADAAGDDGRVPDYRFGWGLMNLERAASVVINEGGLHHIEEIAMFEGDTLTREWVGAAAGGPLMITIAWTDPEGSPLPYGPEMLNNRTPMLINDLDLRVFDGEETFKPWMLDPDEPAAPATRGDNRVDNVEQVVVENPVPGRTYTVRITHKEELRDSLQLFSLIASGIGGALVCESGAEDERDSRIDGFRLHDVDNTTNEGCHTYRDFSNQIANLEIGSSYDFEVDIGTCGEENDRMLKIYVDWNADNRFDESELVATSGLFSESGTFTGSLEVPSFATAGRLVRLRIVLVETNDPDEISPCGTYAAGETQDYLLRIESPRIDLSLEDIVVPEEALWCASDRERLTLRLRNKGQEPIDAYAIEAEIYENGNLLKSLSKQVERSLEPHQFSQVQLSTPFATLPGKQYRVDVRIETPGDLVPENDQLSLQFETAPLQDPVGSSHATRCQGNDTLSLYASAYGPVFWHDAAVNGSIIAAGDTTQGYMPQGEVVYAGVNTLGGSIGPETKNTAPWTGGTYTQVAITPYFTTHVPLIIHSATVYVGWPGEVTFRVENRENHQVVAETTLYMDATRTTPNPSLGMPDDPDDPGREYQLNLVIPEPGDYLIRASYADRITLFRNTSNSESPYPYVVPGVIEITGSDANVPENSYYWLYNIQLRSLECPGERSAQDVEILDTPQVSITSSTNPDRSWTLDAGSHPDCEYLWSNGETSQVITVSESGTYTVWVTNELGCIGEDSAEVTIDDTAVRREMLEGVSLYPNPSHGVFTVDAPTPVQVEVFNLAGMKMLATQAGTTHRLRTDLWSPAVYLVRVICPESGKQAHFRLLVE